MLVSGVRTARPNVLRRRNEYRKCNSARSKRMCEEVAAFSPAKTALRLGGLASAWLATRTAQLTSAAALCLPMFTTAIRTSCEEAV